MCVWRERSSRPLPLGVAPRLGVALIAESGPGRRLDGRANTTRARGRLLDGVVFPAGLRRRRAINVMGFRSERNREALGRRRRIAPAGATLGLGAPAASITAPLARPTRRPFVWTSAGVLERLTRDLPRCYCLRIHVVSEKSIASATSTSADRRRRFRTNNNETARDDGLSEARRAIERRFSYIRHKTRGRVSPFCVRAPEPDALMID